MKSKTTLKTSPGSPFPLGATLTPQGVQFVLFSQHATSVTLCLFSPDRKPICEIDLESKTYKTGFIWHIHVEGIHPPLYYAYKIDGPKEGDLFFAYQPEIFLLDPYAKEVASTHRWSARTSYHPLGAVLPPQTFDWQNVAAPNHSIEDLVVYEMHVRGFTEHPSSGVAHPGTFIGLIEKIPHLKEIGITAVELLPIYEFNEGEVSTVNPKTKKKLCQYWGYSTVNFFAPMNRYATKDEIGAVTSEFKTLVRELHRNGIEVILDVVYNHTAEGNETGPTYSFKGIDNPVYYICEPNKKYANYSGCGNTFNCNHPIVIDLILDSLRYWVLEMHVDGFRFDLASILQRGRQGQPLDPSPLIEAISVDPLLANIKLIAEPWDAAGLYHVGYFYSQETRWAEWNGKYRDAVRKYIKGTPGTKGEFSTRLCGSQDLYHNRTPTTSLNFVIAHDGFTLYDLVSYNEKHNEQNGEENRDGTNDNESWNCGEEGETQNKQVNDLRQKQLRNFHLALMVSLGVPMVLMGDEYARTQKGNNNTWCQDNDLNWFNWDQLQTQGNFKRFYSLINQLRKSTPLLKKGTFLGEADVVFHGAEPLKPDWSAENMFLAYTLVDSSEGKDVYLAFNAKAAPQIVEFPDPPEGKAWHMLVYTAAPSPNDIIEEQKAPPLASSLFKMAGYSSLLLKAY